MFAYVEPEYSRVVRSRAGRSLKNRRIGLHSATTIQARQITTTTIMMVGHLRATRLPGALGLMGSFLGGSYLVGRWRRWRARDSALAVF